jgi:hypothetical protein
MRYYFHVRDGECLIPDREGSELPNLNAARDEAWLSARDFAIDSLRGGAAVNGRQIEITDEAGLVLATLPVRDVTQPLH